MDQPSGGSSARDQVNRWVPALLTLLTALIVVARLWLVFRRLYDPDELQHLHAGYCVWHGMVPYRDFFEQHQPVLWYLSLPLFHIFGESLSVLFAGRLFVWLIGAITVGLTWILGTRLFGRFAASIAALLLVIHPPYQEKNVEWRPDNLAVPLLLAGTLCLDRAAGSNGRRWSMLAAVLYSGAFFCTQKVAYVELGMVLGFAWAAFHRNWIARDVTGTVHRSELIGLAIALIAGASLLPAIVWGFFYQQGALQEFLELTLIAPIRWETREPILRYLINQLASGAVFWSTGVAGWVLVAAELLTGRVRSRGEAVIAGGALAHTVGLLHVPAAFQQYYLPLSPLVALLAGHALSLVARGESFSSRAPVMLASLAGIAVLVAAFAVRGLDTLLSLVWIAVMVALLMVAAVLCLLKLRPAGVLLVLMVSAVGAAPYHIVQYCDWRHDHQTQRIEQLMRATDPDDAFFDGFTGYGALRPHAFYVFWINHHSWPMVPTAQKQTGVIAALQNPRTRIVLVDENLVRFLSAQARQVIDQYFEADPRYSDFPTVIVYARRERPLRDINL
jgi:Dolichyl-phosphate-mannose-protein mannosyltransferase